MKKIILLSLVVILFAKCSEDAYDPSLSFTKIYDTQRSDIGYNPIDVIETQEGFIVLAGQEIAGSDFMGVQIIQLGELGNYLAEASLPGEHVIPVGEFVAIDSVNYLFTMNPDTYVAQLVSMGTDPTTADVIPLSNGLQFPLAANKTSNGEVLLLSYSFSNGETVLSRIGTDGQLLAGTGYSIGVGNDADVIQTRVLRHYTDPEHSALPFFCGEAGQGNYYFNGFYNFTLSTLFTDLSGTPSGVVQGQRANGDVVGGFTYIMPLNTNTYSVFGYQYNDNFVQPTLTLDTQGTSSSIDYQTIPFTEFKSRTKAVIRAYNLNGTDYSIVAAETQSRQVALHFYNIATGELDGIHNVGYLNPYTLGTIRVDAENNLLVLGTTLVSGRFERVFLNKISEEELDEIIN